MNKIAIVVARYGVDINGGAEMHARMLAEHLKRNYTVQILTTCAKDNFSWGNYYEKGEETINNIDVIRFKSEGKDRQKERKLSRYLRRSQRYGQTRITWRNFFYLPLEKFRYRKKENHDEIFNEWLRQQGPYCPTLVDFINKNKDQYTTFIFFTYLYYPTYFGIQNVGNKSILIPTAHDESPFYFGGMSKLFSAPTVILYNTLSEKKLVETTYPQAKEIHSDIVGVGFDKPDFDAIDIEINSPYIVYIGRLDRRKGYKELIQYFQYYKKIYDNDTKLILIGGGADKNDKTSNDIIFTGFVSEKEKLSYLKNSKALIIPSRYESLSMVTLEAMSIGKPVLAIAKSEVLRDHIESSKAGFLYNDKIEFASALNKVLSLSEAEKNNIANNGTSYVSDNYSWPTIEEKLEKAINYVNSNNL
ncbi:MAG: glycosyltransferase family 4 protein [Dysgonomonas sp.]